MRTRASTAIHLDFYTGTLVTFDVVELMRPHLEGKFGKPIETALSRPGAKQSLLRGEMRRELIPTVFHVEFLGCDMIA